MKRHEIKFEDFNDFSTENQIAFGPSKVSNIYKSMDLISEYNSHTQNFDTYYLIRCEIERWGYGEDQFPQALEKYNSL